MLLQHNLANAQYCYWKIDDYHGIQHHWQTDKCHSIWTSNKLFYMRCFENAEKRRKKKKEKADAMCTWYPKKATTDTKRRPSDKRTDVASFPLKLNFFNRRSFQQTEKNKKKRKKKSGWHHDMISDKSDKASAGRQSDICRLISII